MSKPTDTAQFFEDLNGGAFISQIGHALSEVAAGVVDHGKASSESDHAVSETRTSRSAMDQIEATSKETLPASLVFSVVPYEGLSVRNITLRVSVITSGTQPMLKLRWIGEEVQREEIAQEFKSVLDTQIGAATPLTLGTFDPK